MPISLEKIQAQAPELVANVQHTVSLLKETRLEGHVSKCFLVIDISGSMHRAFQSGRVQKLAEKALAIATQFDDDGEIDVLAFDDGARYVGTMNLDNFRTFIDQKVAPLVGGSTYYAPVMKKVLEQYGIRGTEAAKKKPGFLAGLFGKKLDDSKLDAPTPAAVPGYVMFITDGDNFDKPEAKEVIKDASKYPIFWQFMGLGQRNQFPFLIQLDEMSGRFVDNANFFAVEDPANVPDTDMLKLMLGEYPSYITAAQNLGLVR